MGLVVGGDEDEVDGVKGGEVPLRVLFNKPSWFCSAAAACHCAVNRLEGKDNGEGFSRELFNVYN